MTLGGTIRGAHRRDARAEAGRRPVAVRRPGRDRHRAADAAAALNTDYRLATSTAAAGCGAHQGRAGGDTHVVHLDEVAGTRATAPARRARRGAAAEPGSHDVDDRRGRDRRRRRHVLAAGAAHGGRDVPRPVVARVRVSRRRRRRRKSWCADAARAARARGRRARGGGARGGIHADRPARGEAVVPAGRPRVRHVGGAADGRSSRSRSRSSTRASTARSRTSRDGCSTRAASSAATRASTPRGTARSSPARSRRTSTRRASSASPTRRSCSSRRS